MAGLGSGGLTAQVFERIAAIATAEAGIILPEAKRAMVHSRLSRRLRALNLPDFEVYCALLESDVRHPERRELINSLTTNVTRFLREPHHFKELTTEILPALVKNAKASKRIRFWSAGCSSGEEAYSIAYTVACHAPELLSADFKILATDIDENVLEKARSARFTPDVIAGAPEIFRPPHFRMEGDVALPEPHLSGQITCKRHNLIGEWPMRGPFDVIFCRNVLIYFDLATQNQILRHFSERMEPGAALFLGHSERVDASLASRFELKGMTSYRRR